MSIQWYPGHMHKAQKEIKEILPKVDLLIEVLDARIPFSSINPMIADLRGDKPCIKVLSKSDLADSELTSQWQAFFEREKQVKTWPITTEQPGLAKRIPALCREMLPHKTRIQAMIVGIPNVGKSTLINILAGRAIAKTGNEPAITKGQQRIHISDEFVLWDTPGMMWPKVENPHSGYRLAATGAIKDTAIDYDDVAFYIADLLRHSYPQALQQRYGLKSLPKSEIELLELIGAKRGCLGRGGRVDLNKAADIVLTELRAGTLGPLTLEQPEQVEKELIEVERDAQRKAEKKAQRLAQKNKGKRQQS